MSYPMWDYWRDKKGAARALDLQYPGLMDRRPDLRRALTMMQAAQALIDQIMAEVESEEAGR